MTQGLGSGRHLLINYILSSDGDPDPVWKRILIHISGRLGSILIFIKHFLFVLRISKTFVFFLRTSGEYLKKYRQRSVFKTDPWKRILKTDPCPNLVKYSLNVLTKKTNILDNFNTDKKCFMKINIEPSPPEIWIRIRFHTGSGSPSLHSGPAMSNNYLRQNTRSRLVSKDSGRSLKKYIKIFQAPSGPFGCYGP